VGGDWGVTLLLDSSDHSLIAGVNATGGAGRKFAPGGIEVTCLSCAHNADHIQLS